MIVNTYGLKIQCKVQDDEDVDDADDVDEECSSTYTHLNDIGSESECEKCGKDKKIEGETNNRCINECWYCEPCTAVE